MELKDLYGKYQTLKELATVPPEEIEPRLRAGMEGKIRSAQSEIPKIEQAYKNKAVSDCAIIAVKGKFGKKFAEISKDFKTLPVDYLKVVDLIGDSILKRGGRDAYSSQEHFMAMDELNKIKMNYGISQLPVFQAKFDGVGPDTTIKQALFKQLIAQYGGQLFSAVTRGEIGNGALEIGFDGKTLPVILYNYAVDLDTTMLPYPLDVVTINEEPTAQSVKDTLLAARNKLK